MTRGKKQAGACTVPGCPGKPRGHGLCQKHYSRWRVHGSTADPPQERKPIVDRFKKMTEWRGDCLIWTGSLNGVGYGQVYYHGKLRRAHRVAYELAFGSVPEGLVIDHLCHHRACVNPAHLMPVTMQQNNENRSGAEPGAVVGLRGVSKTSDGKYRARVMHDRIEVQLGVFETKEEAAAAALEGRLKYMSHSDLSVRNQFKSSNRREA